MPNLALGKVISLEHGAGARATRALISALILKYFNNKILSSLDDASEIKTNSLRLAFSADGYTVSPLFFPGGDIGHIAVCGTVNDLAVKGATPKYLSVSFIIEAGLEIKTFERILKSMAAAAKKAGVAIVTGDTKVVPKGSCDKIFVVTSGVGEIIAGANISSKNIKPGDAIIVSGALGEHGMCIMNERYYLGFKGLKSDGAALNKEAALLAIFAHCMRDLTRGGLASALSELAESSKVKMIVDENSVPVKPAVRAAARLFGLDPLHSANEGKLVCFAPAARAARALQILGKEARLIGTVTKGRGVYLKTPAGLLRPLKEEDGELLPRVC